MNRLLLLLICLGIGFAFNDRYLNFEFAHLHKVCEFDAKTLCEDFGYSIVESTPFEDLKRLTHGQEAYPCLKYDPPTKDACMWQALFNNKIKSDECVAALERQMAKTIKLTTTANRDGDVTLKKMPIPTKKNAGHYYFVYYPKPIWVHVIAFLSHCYMNYLLVDSLLRSGTMCSRTVYLTILNLSALLLCITPIYSLGMIMLITLKLISKTSSVEEEEEEAVDDKCYRRMDEEDEETIYVAVPLRVV